MANIVKYIAPSGTTILSEMKDALVTKYGVGITIHYQTTTDLIFTCQAISSKVIRFNCTSDLIIKAYYGDAWTSTTTITNPITIANTYYGPYSLWYDITFALGDEYILLNAISTSSETYSLLILIGKTTMAQDLVVAAVGSASSSNIYPTFKSRLIATGEDVRLGGFQSKFLSPTGILYKLPLYIVSSTANRLLLDGSSNPLTVNGLSACTYPGSTNRVYGKFPHQHITTCSMYDYLGVNTVSNPILIEY